MSRSGLAQVVVAALGVVLVAAEAPVCITGNCFCRNEGATGAEEAEIVALGADMTASVRLGAVHGDVGGDRVGDTVVVDTRHIRPPVGARVLVAVFPPQARDGGDVPISRSADILVDGAGTASCWGNDSLTLPVADAVAAMLAQDCYDRTVARGFVENGCDDHGCGCAGGPGAGALVLAGLAVRRRRQR